MTNEKRQEKLDKKKWFESEKQGFDMGGCMLYCELCEFGNHESDYGFCKASQEQRKKECLCAKAFNRVEKINRGAKNGK